jgi:GxxExxY protein
MYTDRNEINGITERIIGCAFTVANTLKTGYAEKVYENSLAIELRKNGLRVAQQVGVTVHYDGVNVGDYTTDLLMEDIVLVELKAVRALDPSHTAQCLNYMTATGLPLCLLLNFGNPRLEIKRLVNGT